MLKQTNSLSLSVTLPPSLPTLLACDIMMWGWRHGKGELHALLHGCRSLASRIPSHQDSIFLHISKGGNFSGFSSFSSISQNQKRQGKRNVVQVNNKFHNPFLVSKRFYCVDPPHNNVPPRGLIGFYKWFLEKFETVPYTKRTRFILPTIAQERIGGEKEFKELKLAFESEGKILPPTHPDNVRVTIIFKNIIDALQRGLKKMENVSSSQEPTTMLLHIIRTRLLEPEPSTLHLEGLNWEVLVVDYPDVAGQCYPGGKIAVFTALLHHFGSDAEIATIIGHEVAHVVARHSAERFTRTLWIFYIHNMLNQFVTIDFANRMSSIIPRLPFNKQFEMEADYIGLLLMASAGYDPLVVPKIYEKMGKSKETDNDSMLRGYLSTHPPGIKRAKALDRAEIMKEALFLYKDVYAQRLSQYSSTRNKKSQSAGSG